MLKHPAHLLVLHLGQRRVHHQDQPDRDGNRRGTHAETVEKRHHAGHQISKRRRRRPLRRISKALDTDQERIAADSLFPSRSPLRRLGESHGRDQVPQPVRSS